MAICKEDVYKEIKPHFRTLWNCMAEGFKFYVDEYPSQEIHRKTTRAGNVVDEIFARVVSAFDAIPGTQIIDNPNQPRVLSLSPHVTLWFKKLNEKRLTANYPTVEALKRDTGQIVMFEQADIIVAGYMLNEDESAVSV